MKKLIAVVLAITILLPILAVNGFTANEGIATVAEENEIVVFDNPSGDDLEVNNPWDFFGVGNWWGDNKDLNISFEDVKKIIAAGGATFSFTYSGTNPGTPKVLFNFYKYNSDGEKFPGNTNEAPPEYDEIYALCAVSSFGENMYAASVKLDDLVDAWKAVGRTLDDSEAAAFLIQPWISDFKLHSAKFILPSGADPSLPDAPDVPLDGFMAGVEIKTFCPDNYIGTKNGTAYGRVDNRTYWSNTTGNERPVNIVLPVNYSKDKKYPVMYILHGIFCDQNTMMNAWGTHTIIQNMIADGTAKEMILVFPNMYAAKDKNMEPSFGDLESVKPYDDFLFDLVNDLMPFIESEYSVATGKDNTAIFGFSMGGREALATGFTYPQKFGYVGAVAPAPGLTPGKDFAFTHPGQFAESELKFGSEKPYLLMIGAGDKDKTVGDFPKSYHKILNRNVTQHIWYEIPGSDHADPAIASVTYNFAKYAFKATNTDVEAPKGGTLHLEIGPMGAVLASEQYIDKSGEYTFTASLNEATKLSEGDQFIGIKSVAGNNPQATSFSDGTKVTVLSLELDGVKVGLDPNKCSSTVQNGVFTSNVGIENHCITFYFGFQWQKVTDVITSNQPDEYKDVKVTVKVEIPGSPLETPPADNEIPVDISGQTYPSNEGSLKFPIPDGVDVSDGSTVVLRLKGTANSTFRVYLSNAFDNGGRVTDISYIEPKNGAFNDVELTMPINYAIEGNAKPTHVIVKGIDYLTPLDNVTLVYMAFVIEDSEPDDPVYDPVLVRSIFGDKIALEYAVLIPSDVTDPVMEFTVADNTFTVAGRTELEDSDNMLSAPDGYVRWFFICEGVTPAQIDETIYAKIKGHEDIEIPEFSILDYCEERLENSDSIVFKQLVSELVRYASSASKLNNGTPIEMDDNLLLPAKAVDPYENKIAVKGEGWDGATLVLDNTITMHLFYKGNVAPKISDIDAGGHHVEIKKGYVEITGFTPLDYDDVITATIGDSTVTYSVGSYISRMSEKGSELTKEIVTNLQNYGRAAEAYAKATDQN